MRTLINEDLDEYSQTRVAFMEHIRDIHVVSFMGFPVGLPMALRELQNSEAIRTRSQGEPLYIQPRIFALFRTRSVRQLPAPIVDRHSTRTDSRRNRGPGHCGVPISGPTPR